MPNKVDGRENYSFRIHWIVRCTPPQPPCEIYVESRKESEEKDNGNESELKDPERDVLIKTSSKYILGYIVNFFLTKRFFDPCISPFADESPLAWVHLKQPMNSHRLRSCILNHHLIITCNTSPIAPHYLTIKRLYQKEKSEDVTLSYWKQSVWITNSTDSYKNKTIWEPSSSLRNK